LELSEVSTHSVRVFLSLMSIGIEIFLITYKEKSRAFWNPE
jgi:hypothetical protein